MNIFLISIFLSLTTSSFGTLSTIFPFLFPRTTTPRPGRIYQVSNNEVRREFTHRTTDFFLKKSRPKPPPKKTRLSLQVSLGPMIFPESYEETTTPLSVNVKPSKYKTTTETPDYAAEYFESEEEILSEGSSDSKQKPNKQSSAVLSFFQHLKDKFPSIHDWMTDKDEPDSSESVRSSRQLSKTFFTSKKKAKSHSHKTPKPVYGVPNKPKTVITPPHQKKHQHHHKQQKTLRRPLPIRRPSTTPFPTTFEEEKDIQPAGQIKKPKPKFRKPKLIPRRPKIKIRPTKPSFEQFPAEESEQDIQPGGQRPQLSTLYSLPPAYEEDKNILPGGQKPGGYIYPKPEISKEIFFYEPPKSFAPSQQKPLPKPSQPLQPKKQYKAIFIKAPEPEPPIIPNIPQIQPAPEQKTLIYVVAKKPQEPPNITIPLPPETQTEKPDVFFIRYKVTTPQPDETDKEILPAGQRPGYKYPKPRPITTTTTPPPDEETEDEVLPGGQEPPPDEYLPPDESEEEVLPGGQEEPTDEYLPPPDEPDEDEQDIQPGGFEPTTEEPPETEKDIQPGGQTPSTTTPPPSTEYLPPPMESEKEILPAGQLPPSNQYLPQPPPSNQYLPQSQIPTNQYLPSSNQYLYPISNQYIPQTQSLPNNYSPYNQQSGYNQQQSWGNQNQGYNTNTGYYIPPSGGYQNYNTQKTKYPTTSYNNGYYNSGSGYQRQPNGWNLQPQQTHYYNNNNNRYVPPKNIHTIYSTPSTQLTLPLHRQGILHQDTTLDSSLLFSSLGLSPF